MRMKSLFFLILLLSLGGCAATEVAAVEAPEPRTYPAASLLDAHLTLLEEKAYFRQNPPEPPAPPEPVGLFDAVRPYGVMIDNHVGARPQSGLAMATVVYEALAEGPITRYLMIIPASEEGVVGPVRSARPYFIAFALEYQSLYAHAGGSEDALATLNKLKVASLNGLSSGEAAFYRTTDRRAPHNLYTSTERLAEEARRKGYAAEREEPVSALMAYDRFKPLEGGEKAGAFEVIYKPGTAADPLGYGVSYVYEKELQLYQRFVNGSEQRDEATEESITAGNVLVIEMTHKVLDSAGRRALGIIGAGEGIFLTGGEMIPIEWAKASFEAPTRFTAAGEAVVFNPGRVFIQVVNHLEQFKLLKEDTHE